MRDTPPSPGKPPVGFGAAEEALAAAVAAGLRAWYRKAGRPLPWRADPDPYRVVVSEFMLQQTRAETAAAYFARFVAAFPDFAALARAPEEEVLRLWEGLGYYRRARHLHALAREVVARHGGVLPADKEALRALPGVGPYTAAAVRVFAFGEPDAPLDANLGRIFRRLRPEADPARLAAATVAPDPFAVGQALMDLGALVCRPRRPRCEVCPLVALCATRGEGAGAGTKATRPKEAVTILVAHDEKGRVLAARRERGLLRGLWGLPMAPEDDLASWLPAARPLGGFRHGFSHRTWEVRVVAARVAAARPPFRLHTSEELAALPFGRPFRRALELWRRS